MNCVFGRYAIQQRTPYSKIRLINIDTNEDITNTDNDMFEKVISDYMAQKSHPEDFFEIEGRTLIGYNSPLEKLNFIFIPDGVENIKMRAFKHCEFSYVHFPESLKTIERHAFASCTSLKEIYLPDLVSAVELGTFDDCGNLEYIKLPKYLKKINEQTFFSCSRLSNIIFPDALEQIDDLAFANCVKLKRVNLPPSLKSLGKSVFSNCMKLSAINLKDGLEEIGKNCFYCCEALKKIIIPDTVEKLGERAFENCTSLETVKLPNKLGIAESMLFANCSALKNVTLPDSCFGLSDSLFCGADNLENINIPMKLYYAISHPFAFSEITSLTFNHDLSVLDTAGYNLLENANINKIIIGPNVKIITPDAFGVSGDKILTIDYMGTKEEFEDFKNNNKELFKQLSDIRKVNIMGSRENNKDITTDNIMI